MGQPRLLEAELERFAQTGHDAIGLGRVAKLTRIDPGDPATKYHARMWHFTPQPADGVPHVSWGG